MYIALWSFIIRKLLTNEYWFVSLQSVVNFYVFKFCLYYTVVKELRSINFACFYLYVSVVVADRAGTNVRK
jgi:hypothetical protein